ncbi:MAG TPA: hypothetical protein VGB50_01435 [Flavobacterium sp.]|jgi:hypothetical protein
MEDNKKTGMNDREDQGNPQYESSSENHDAYETRPTGDDIVSEGQEHRHHQQHGNRKYQSHTNHSSANDQPGNTTDTNLGREHNF